MYLPLPDSTWREPARGIVRGSGQEGQIADQITHLNRLTETGSLSRRLYRHTVEIKQKQG